MKPNLVSYKDVISSNQDISLNNNKMMSNNIKIKKNKLKGLSSFFLNIFSIMIIILILYFLRDRYINKERNKLNHIKKINDLEKLVSID